MLRFVCCFPFSSHVATAEKSNQTVHLYKKRIKNNSTGTGIFCTTFDLQSTTARCNKICKHVFDTVVWTARITRIFSLCLFFFVKIVTITSSSDTFYGNAFLPRRHIGKRKQRNDRNNKKKSNEKGKEEKCYQTFETLRINIVQFAWWIHSCTLECRLEFGCPA